MIGLYVSIIDNFKSNQEEWKTRIMNKFIDSANLPRKRKKKIRKHLQLQWEIAHWNPLDF
jgi:hypothetical protein